MTTYIYMCKFPHRDAVWHKVEAPNMAAARRKFTKGSKYKPNQIKIKRV